MYSDYAKGSLFYNADLKRDQTLYFHISTMPIYNTNRFQDADLKVSHFNHDEEAKGSLL